MEVVIRPFRPDDWDGLFLLDRSCFEPPFRLEVPRLRALVQDPTSVVVVIEARDGEETAVVGSLIVKHDAPSHRLVLIGIMVDEGFRRVGLGRRLAGWAERMARARAYGEVLAPLEAENEGGGAFLEAVGFTREPGALPFFDDPAGGNLWRRTVQEAATIQPQAAAEEPKTAEDRPAAAAAPEPAPAQAETPQAPATESAAPVSVPVAVERAALASEPSAVQEPGLSPAAAEPPAPAPAQAPVASAERPRKRKRKARGGSRSRRQ